jgi:hypothetical protein
MTTVRSTVCPQVRTVFSPKKLAKVDSDLPELVEKVTRRFTPPHEENKPLVYRVNAGKDGLYVTARRQLSTVESKKTESKQSLIDGVKKVFAEGILGKSPEPLEKAEKVVAHKAKKGTDFIPKGEYEHGLVGLLTSSMHRAQTRLMLNEFSFKRKKINS